MKSLSKALNWISSYAWLVSDEALRFVLTPGSDNAKTLEELLEAGEGVISMSEPTVDVLNVTPMGGYEIRKELVTFQLGSEEMTTISDSAYTLDGAYIGTPKWAAELASRGIVPALATPDSEVCSIGFCEAEQKWYGWSHRAIYGFGVGYVVREDSLVTDSGWTDEYLAMNPTADKRVPVGFEAKTLEDAKRLAIAYADAVG